MLENSDDAIDRIAARVGYEATTAFSKAFRQHYGISPGRFGIRDGATTTHSCPLADNWRWMP